MSIEQKNFIATVADIKALATANADAAENLVETRATYLKALVGTARWDLKSTKVTTNEEQLKSLKAVHDRFYAAVQEAVITPDIAKQTRIRGEEATRRAQERQRRTNFARSAYSTVRSWLKAGNDLMGLKAATVTKAQLAVETPGRKSRPASAELVKKRADALVERMLDATRKLASANPTEARAILDAAMQQIARELFQGAVQPTTDSKVAAAEHRPLKVGTNMFWPTETQVARRERMRLAA